MLREKRIHVNCRDTDNHGTTPLMYAAALNLQYLAMMLIEQNADKTIQRIDDGLTAAEMAISHPEIARLINTWNPSNAEQSCTYIMGAISPLFRLIADNDVGLLTEHLQVMDASNLLTITDLEGDTLFQDAAKRRRIGIMKLLHKKSDSFYSEEMRLMIKHL